MGKIAKSFMAISAIVWATGSWAADHRILMLDTGSEGIMVFDPPFLQIAKGESVTFVAKDPGHNVISHLVPAGAAKWKGAVSKDFTVSFDKEGVYIYECDLHHPLVFTNSRPDHGHQPLTLLPLTYGTAILMDLCAGIADGI